MVPVSLCCGDAVDALVLGVAPAAAALAAAGELLGVCAADAVFSGSTGWAWPDGVWSDELGEMPNVALVLGDALEADSEDAFALEISACAEATASEACRVSFEVPPQALNKQTPATVQESSPYSFRAELFIRGLFPHVVGMPPQLSGTMIVPENRYLMPCESAPRHTAVCHY